MFLSCGLFHIGFVYFVIVFVCNFGIGMVLAYGCDIHLDGEREREYAYIYIYIYIYIDIFIYMYIEFAARDRRTLI